MICILEFVAVLGLVLTGFAVLIGVIKPADAAKRVGGFLLVVFVAPAAIAYLFRSLIMPALASLWAAAKPALTVVGAIAVFILLAWIVLAAVEHRLGAHQ
jgi:hypothetical protein